MPVTFDTSLIFRHLNRLLYILSTKTCQFKEKYCFWKSTLDRNHIKNPFILSQLFWYKNVETYWIYLLHIHFDNMFVNFTSWIPYFLFSGESVPDNDPCKRCSCRRGLIMCAMMSCAACDGPRLPGQCCRSCSPKPVTIT